MRFSDPKIQDVSALTGVSPGEVLAGMRGAGTNDPLVGACYTSASSLAVVIKGDRHEWNLRYAQAQADRLREVLCS